MTHIPPGVIAAADQHHAHIDDLLDDMVREYRHHTDLHGGDTLCARSTVAVAAVIGGDCRMTAELLAAAIARIARSRL